MRRWYCARGRGVRGIAGAVGRRTGIGRGHGGPETMREPGPIATGPHGVAGTMAKGPASSVAARQRGGGDRDDRGAAGKRPPGAWRERAADERGDRRGPGPRDDRGAGREDRDFRRTPASGRGAGRLELPEGITADQLDPEARAELRTLPGQLAEAVACWLVAASAEPDPDRAFDLAVHARKLAARVGVVRETAGVAAYRACRWADALAELRTARRLTGRASYLPLMADAERALGSKSHRNRTKYDITEQCIAAPWPIIRAFSFWMRPLPASTQKPSCAFARHSSNWWKAAPPS